MQRTVAACDRGFYLGWTEGRDAAGPPAWHPYRGCNQCRYLADVEHNTAVWVLVWIFVAALALAIVDVAVVLSPT
jgi:hypothetical protein